VHVTINGRLHDCEPASSILCALRRVGIEIPALCHDDRLQPTAECRPCLVHLKKGSQLVPACATPIEDGMMIETYTPELEAHRRSLLQMLAWRYPAAAVDQFSDKPLHRALRAYGLTGEARDVAVTDRRDRSHPYLTVDMSRCIDCYRCVRTCNEVQGSLCGTCGRADCTRASCPTGRTYTTVPAVACGACVDTCPTGALEDAGTSRLTITSHWTRTTCPYCPKPRPTITIDELCRTTPR
jgi:formate dehydrogenase major subunit